MTNVPSQLHFALSLALIKAKPEGISIRDHILRLRKHISNGVRPQFSATYQESQHNYLNAALYYKALYEELLAKESELKNKISYLERTVDSISSVPRAYSSSRSNIKGLQKTSMPDRESDCHQPAINDFDGLFSFSNSDIEPIRVQNREAFHALIGYIYSLSKLLYARADKLQISTLLQKAISAIQEVLLVFSKKFSARMTQDPREIADEIQSFFTAIWRMIDIVVRSYKFLLTNEIRQSPKDDSGDSRGLTTSLTALFSSIVDVHGISVEYCVKARNKAFQPCENQNRTRSQNDMGSVFEEIIGTAAGIVSKFALAILQQEKYGASIYDSLIDGMICVTLTRAGTLIHTLSFFHGQKSSIEAEIRGDVEYISGKSQNETSFPARNAEAIDLTQPSELHRDKRDAAEAEGSNILPTIRLLLSSWYQKDILQGSAPEEIPVLVLQKLRKFGLVDFEGERDETSLSLRSSLYRIQNILLRGIFGAEPSLDPSFTCKLDFSPSVGLLVDEQYREKDRINEAERGTSNTGIDEKGQWFIEQMWNLCGWDVLAASEHISF